MNGDLKKLVESTNAEMYSDQELEKALQKIDAEYDEMKAEVEDYDESPVKGNQLAKVEHDRRVAKKQMINMFKAQTKEKDPTDAAWDKHFNSLAQGGPGNIQDYRYGS
jgi:uncharacterized protein YhaN